MPGIEAAGITAVPLPRLAPSLRCWSAGIRRSTLGDGNDPDLRMLKKKNPTKMPSAQLRAQMKSRQQQHQHVARDKHLTFQGFGMKVLLPAWSCGVVV